MFIPWHDPAIRLTGRWTHQGYPPVPGEARRYDVTVTTAPGSSLELAFSGRDVRLVFDLGYAAQPLPHLWLCLDGQAWVEVPLDRHLRITAPDDGPHILHLVYKGGPEVWPRWHPPLMGAVAFAGAFAEAAATLPPDDRLLVEFVGDSITEGVLVDADFAPQPCNLLEQFDRPYQDDSSATYASLTARRLNLRPMFQAYGAVGAVRHGCGGVPDAPSIYPYVVDGIPYAGPAPRIVVVNHGTNDAHHPPEVFAAGYDRLLDAIRQKHPGTVIVCLSPFCGVFEAEIAACVARRRQDGDPLIHFISTQGWLPREPIHPLREGHRAAADRLTPLLESIIHHMKEDEP